MCGRLVHLLDPQGAWSLAVRRIKQEPRRLPEGQAEHRCPGDLRPGGCCKEWGPPYSLSPALPGARQQAGAAEVMHPLRRVAWIAMAWKTAGCPKSLLKSCAICIPQVSGAMTVQIRSSRNQVLAFGSESRSAAFCVGSRLLAQHGDSRAAD